MQKVTIYLSMDGTVFNNELDCVEYELKHDLEQNGITFFSAEGREIIDATMAYRILIKCDEVPESLLDAIYSYCGATELPKTKGTWIIKSGREQNDDNFCMNCSYFHKDYGEEKSCCHNDRCFEFGWVKEGEINE